jgi:hypothetical protein
LRYPDHHTKLTITLLRCSCGYPRRGTVLFDASNNGCLILEFATVAESWTPLHARRSGGEDAGGRGGSGGARRGPDRVEDCLPLDRDGRGNHDAKRLAALFDAGPRAAHAKRGVPASCWRTWIECPSSRSHHHPFCRIAHRVRRSVVLETVDD